MVKAVNKKHNINIIYPVDQYLLVRLPKIEEKTAGGIILMDSQINSEQSGTDTGEIIKLGAAAIVQYNGDAVANIGDSVMFQKYAGYMLYGTDDEVYRLVLDKDIIAVFPK